MSRPFGQIIIQITKTFILYVPVRTPAASN